MDKKHSILLAMQLLAILFCGILSGDTAFAIINALIGIVFNFFVSINYPTGFLFGFVYAVTNGILAFKTSIYATCAFMFLLQAPMAIYSFIKWYQAQNNKNGEMKIMNKRQLVILGCFMLLLGVIMYFVLSLLNSSSVIFDDIFFVFSVTACLLLAFYYKNAYIITLLSGLFGTILWSVQYFATQQGLSVAVFYLIVLINSVIAVYTQYFKKLRK